MRLQHDIVEAEQGLGHLRLPREHVQAGGAEPAAHHGFDQRRLVDHRAARDIDQPALGPERLDHLAPDQSGGFGAALAGDDQHVDVARQLARIAVVAPGDVVLASRAGVADHHAEGLRQLGDPASDAAETDDAQASPGERARERGIALLGPAP